jgi:hypothetical protein
VRPNLWRTDFGYVERRKPAKKQRRDDDGSGPANGGPREPRVRTSVDFTKLGMATLKKYKRHYRLKARTRIEPAFFCQTGKCAV